jgi:hypothetical protein
VRRRRAPIGSTRNPHHRGLAAGRDRRPWRFELELSAATRKRRCQSAHGRDSAVSDCRPASDYSDRRSRSTAVKSTPAAPRSRAADTAFPQHRRQPPSARGARAAGIGGIHDQEPGRLFDAAHHQTGLHRSGRIRFLPCRSGRDCQAAPALGGRRRWSGVPCRFAGPAWCGATCVWQPGRRGDARRRVARCSELIGRANHGRVCEHTSGIWRCRSGSCSKLRRALALDRLDDFSDANGTLCSNSRDPGTAQSASTVTCEAIDLLRLRGPCDGRRQVGRL